MKICIREDVSGPVETNIMKTAQAILREELVIFEKKFKEAWAFVNGKFAMGSLRPASAGFPLQIRLSFWAASLLEKRFSYREARGGAVGDSGVVWRSGGRPGRTGNLAER